MLAVTIPFHFSHRLDHENRNYRKTNGIQWKILTQLDELDFADDLALMYHSHRQMQDKTTVLARISAQVGLKINKEKTKILRLNTICERPIEGDGLEEVEIHRRIVQISR